MKLTNVLTIGETMLNKLIRVTGYAGKQRDEVGEVTRIRPIKGKGELLTVKLIGKGFRSFYSDKLQWQGIPAESLPAYGR